MADIDCSLADDLLVHGFGLPSSLGLPISDGACIQTKGKHHCWDGTASGQQRQHATYQPERMLEAEQQCAAGFGKGLAANMADVATLFERMDDKR